MKKILIITTFALTAVSCNRAYLALNGIKKPRYETVETVNDKLKQYSDAYPGLNAIPADSASFVELLKIVRGLPSNLVFDHEGMLLMPEDTGYCAGRALQFALDLGKTPYASVDEKIRFKDISELIITIGHDVDLNPGNYDYSMFIFWTNFLGKANLNVFKIMEETKNKTDIRINYILINMDVQKSWGMKKIPYQL